MQSKNSIDMLVRQALEGGQEQLNLGAWANMDRMLDGKNPYAKPEDDDKKRGFWLFGTLLIALGLLGSGTFHYFHKKSNFINTTNNQLTVNTDKVNKAATNTDASQSVSNVNQNPTSQANNTDNVIESNKADYATSSDYSNKVTNNAIASNSTNLPTSKKLKISNSVNTNNNEDFLTTQINNNAEVNSLNVNSLNNPKNTNSVVILTTPEGNLSNNGISTNQEINSYAQLEKISINTPQLLPTYAPSDNTLAAIKIPDSITIIKRVLTTFKTDDGEIIDQTKETYVKAPASNKSVAASISEEVNYTNKVVEEKVEDKVSNIVPAKNPKQKSAPKENSKLAKVDKKEQVQIITSTNTNAVDSNNNDNKAEIVTKVSTDKSKAKSVSSSSPNWAQKVMENMVETTKRLGYLKIFNQKLEVNPGVFAGINGSFFNTEHDFGGFQTGTNLMIQIGKNLNLIPHLGFYYRNNGGYGIKDYQTTITNQNVKVSTDGLSNIFTYQLDSTRVNYNFKHIYSFEAPILLQYNRRDFGFYGGVNLAYGLKMNTVNNSKSFTEQKEIILPLGSTYMYPGSQSTYYKSTDFQSRFGIGYVVGGSYDFHPNLYVDFRLTQNLWDNSTTQSAIEMSKKMFRVPSLQLGIGYRFKERERARY